MPPKLDPKTFPRPPLLARTPKSLLIRWPNNGPTIASTTSAYWVLETHHPPTYYIPPADIHVPLTRTARSTLCEWKGRATYFALEQPDGRGAVADRAWAYDAPVDRFKDIAGYVAFYNGPWECFVDGERVQSQPGDFYGGWVTQDIEMASVKGGPGTWGW